MFVIIVIETLNKEQILRTLTTVIQGWFNDIDDIRLLITAMITSKIILNITNIPFRIDL
jgi:hypothetical protein